ncbi:MAG: TIGR03087 family PEP-CTERM/XrtA system glycosyltransferase [Rhodospirillaceae bacterium]
MQDLLFLAHRIPFPPNKGDKIRSWNILEYLAGRYRVHVGCFVDDPHDWRYVDRVRDIAASAHFLPLDRRRGLVRSLGGLFSGESLTRGYYRDLRMTDWVATVAASARLDRVFVYSSSMFQHAPDSLPPGARVVVDLVDVDSDKWRQYADKKRWPASWVYRREARTLLALERRISAAADATLLVSEDEAALFRRLAPASAAKTFGVPNGVDFGYFDPDLACEAPFDPTGDNLVFTGAMDYWANVDAVCWFADEIFPRIRARMPDCRFWIVGANPSSEVLALRDRAGIEVTGRVEDVRPFLAHAAVAVAPLRVARGVQNKVLEAMAMRKPVVATPEAIEGISADAGREVFVEGEPAAFADRVVGLFDRAAGETVGAAARRRIVRSYGWAENLRRIETILEGMAP